MSRLQIIQVLETSDKDKSDDLYLNAIFRRFFIKFDLEGNEVTIQSIFLEGKQNYNSDQVLEQISSYTSMFNCWDDDPGKTVVIYFIDSDGTRLDYDANSYFGNLVRFCNEKGFELVWFSKNFENVFLGLEPDQVSNKTEAAKQFLINNKIFEIDANRLIKEKLEVGCSNIINILSKYLRTK